MRISRQRLLLMALPAFMAFSPEVRGYSYDSANSPVLYGYNDADRYDAVTPLPSGMCSFPLVADGDAVSYPASLGMKQPKVAAYACGKYYSVVMESNWLTGDKFYLDVYDAQTWELLSESELTDFYPQTGFAIDADGTTAYTVANIDYEPHVVALDLSTLESHAVAPLPAYLFYQGLCMAPDGNVYTFNGTDSYLYKTDLTSGETVPVVEIPDFNAPVSAFADSRSGWIYMVMPDGMGMTHVYSLDADTGWLTDFGPTAGGEIITGLYMPDFDPEAPDAVGDVTFEYAAPGSSEAVLSFTMPELAYGGGMLDGDMSTEIVIDGVTEVISASKYEKIRLEKTLAEGLHHISIYAVNSAGKSPERRFRTFTGADVPSAVENLQFSIEDGIARLSWDAPSRSQNGGEFDRRSLNYTVTRQPGGIVVAEGLKATEFEENIGDAFAFYSYVVTPFAGSARGVGLSTGQIKWGDINVPPFVEDFDNWEGNDRFTAYNPSDDGWGWSMYSGNATCMANADTDADYYLFTPRVRLDHAGSYTLSVDVETPVYDRKSALMEIELASAPEADATVAVIDGALSIAPGAKTVYYDFIVDEPGEYYISFRNVTPAGGPQVAVDNIAVSPNSLPSSAASATSIEAVAGEAGALSVTVSGKAPSVTSDGNTLASIDYVEVQRMGSDAAVRIGETAPGASFSWTDTDASQGWNTYAVTVWAGGVKGMTSHVAVFAGIDTPLPVEGILAYQAAPGDIRIEWNPAAAVGCNGGYVDLSAVTYTVYRKDVTDGYYTPVVGSGLTATSISDTEYSLPDGMTQSVVRYIVTASTMSGESRDASAVATLGTPAPLPFTESVTGGIYSHDGWAMTDNAGKCRWDVISGDNMAVAPHDADGGMISFVNSGWAEGSAMLRSPMIATEGAESALLTFYMWHGNEAEPEDLSLNVGMLADGLHRSSLASISYNDGTRGWQRHAVALEGLDNFDNIIIELTGIAADGSAAVMLDEFKFNRSYDNDFELSALNVPASVSAGERSVASVEVSNIGTSASGAEVWLYKDGVCVSTALIDNLDAGESVVIDMDMNVTVGDAYSTLSYNAAVAMDGDEFAGNDWSAVRDVLVKGNTIPVVEVEGEAVEGDVSLSWNRPAESMAVALTDSFEDYSAYALSGFGGWITYDADGARTEFSKFWPQIANAKAPMAWEVWDHAQLEKDGFYEGIPDRDHFAPRTGDKCLISFTAVEESWFGEFASANDNWLISPEIVGGTDVEFWLRSLQSVSDETVEVLWSDVEDIDAAASDVDSFEVLREVSVSGGDWLNVSVTLPVEARRFAIRQTTKANGHILMLDDVTCVPAEGSSKDIEILGYNVYRDNALVASVDSESFSETLAEDGVYVYYVTTLTDAGESCASNPFYADVETGVEMTGAGHAVRVRGVSGGIELSVAAPCGVRIIGTDGLVRFSGRVDTVAVVELPSGVYTIVAGDDIVKVIVR